MSDKPHFRTPILFVSQQEGEGKMCLGLRLCALHACGYCTMNWCALTQCSLIVGIAVFQSWAFLWNESSGEFIRSSELHGVLYHGWILAILLRYV